MKAIMVYKIEADEIERIANLNDLPVAEIVEMLCEYYGRDV